MGGHITSTGCCCLVGFKNKDDHYVKLDSASHIMHYDCYNI